MWYREIADVRVPEAPGHVTYTRNADNIMDVTWEDLSENETSFRLRRNMEEDDLIIPLNSAQLIFDLDTLSTNSFDFAFFMVADNNGDWSLFSDTSKFSVLNGTDITQGNQTDIRIYPNPVTADLHLDFPQSLNLPASISLTGINGIEVFRDTHVNSKAIINMVNFEIGLYLLKIERNDGSFEIVKILKK
jgi:hypothetical protein